VYVFLPAVPVERKGGINQVKKNIVPKGLEGRNGERLGCEQRREGIGACDAERQHLTEALHSASSLVRCLEEYSPKQENDPKVPGLQICEPACFALFDLICRGLRLSMHRGGVAGGQAFAIVVDWRDLLNC